jgi:hypothetical protein
MAGDVEGRGGASTDLGDEIGACPVETAGFLVHEERTFLKGRKKTGTRDRTQSGCFR